MILYEEGTDTKIALPLTLRVGADGRVIVSFGEPFTWDLKDIVDNPPKNGRLIVDALGRSFGVGNMVYCSYNEFRQEVIELLKEYKQTLTKILGEI